jgi:hypothetical protein
VERHPVNIFSQYDYLQEHLRSRNEELDQDADNDKHEHLTKTTTAHASAVVADGDRRIFRQSPAQD